MADGAANAAGTREEMLETLETNGYQGRPGGARAATESQTVEKRMLGGRIVAFVVVAPAATGNEGHFRSTFEHTKYHGASLLRLGQKHISTQLSPWRFSGLGALCSSTIGRDGLA